MKSCARLKREYGRAKYIDLYGDEAWRAPDGVRLRLGGKPNDDLIRPGPNVLRFGGPVALLIGARTFSSAMSCALAAKDYGLATIIGEETGEPANTTGEVYTMSAPASGVMGFFTTKYYEAPKPQPDRQGVVPDIVVRTIPSDTMAGGDPVLARALVELSKRTA